MDSMKLLATALLMAVSISASAWDAPWDRNGHDNWGHRDWNDGFGDFWDDGFGDIFGDAFGDVDFEFRFRASGDGWGRGWGDNFWNGRNRYYNGYNGYNNYRRGPYRGGPYGYGFPPYRAPYGLYRPYGYAPPRPAPAPPQRGAAPSPQLHATTPLQRHAVPPAPRPRPDSPDKQQGQ